MHHFTEANTLEATNGMAELTFDMLFKYNCSALQASHPPASPVVLHECAGSDPSTAHPAAAGPLPPKA